MVHGAPAILVPRRASRMVETVRTPITALTVAGASAAAVPQIPVPVVVVAAMPVAAQVERNTLLLMINMY